MITRILRVGLVLMILLCTFGGGTVFAGVSEETSKEEASKIDSEPIEQTELVSERTEYSRTFLNSDGSTTLEISSKPLFYQEEKGLFAAISPTIQTIGEKDETSYQVIKASYQCNFGDSEEGFLFTYQDHSIRVQPMDVDKPVSGSIYEDVVSYEKVWEHADLIYEIGEDHVKEKIILYSNKASTQYKFRYLLPDKAVVTEVENGLNITVNDGEVSFFVPDPFVYDMVNTNPSFEAVSKDYELNGQELILTYQIDQEWFNSKERVFPVTIDPTISLQHRPYEFTFDGDQTITVELHQYMPAMTTSYAADRFTISDGHKTLMNEVLWNSIISSKRNDVTKSLEVSKGLTYSIIHSVGNGWVPFKIIYGSSTAKITYFQKPITIFSEEDKFDRYYSEFPNLSWEIMYNNIDINNYTDQEIQKEYKIVFSRSLDSLNVGNDFTEKEDCLYFDIESGHTAFDLEKDGILLKEQLDEEGEWYFKVAVSNGGLWSDWSESQSFILDKTAPKFESTELNYIPLENYGVKVEWGNVIENYTEIKYEVMLARDFDENFIKVNSELIFEDEAKIENLMPNQKYKIRVVALDEAGNSSILDGEYVTPAAETKIQKVEFIEDGKGGYVPEVTFVHNHSDAYKIKIFKFNKQQNGYEEVYLTENWIEGSNYNSSLISYKITDVSIERFSKYKFQVATANGERKDWAGLNYCETNEDVKVPNARPEKPMLVSPELDITVKPGSQDEIILKATTVEDYEGDQLAYVIELYELLGELPQTVDDLADNTEFNVLCLEIFNGLYPDYLDEKIRFEYDNNTIATLYEWTGEEYVPDNSDDNNDPGDNQTDPEDPNIIFGTLIITDPGDDDIYDPSLPGTGGNTHLPGSGDDDDDNQIPPDQTIRSVYSFEEYKEIVYDIQYDFYYSDFLKKIREENFAKFVEENATEEELSNIDNKPAELENDKVFATFKNLEEKTYAWRVKVTETNTFEVDGNVSYSSFFTFIVKKTGPQTPTFVMQNRSGTPITAINQTAIRLGNIVYDKGATVRLTVRDTYQSEKDIDLIYRNYYDYTLSNYQGEHTIFLRAYDSLGNYTDSKHTIIYDTIPPQNPTLEDIEVIEGDRLLILKWKPGSDFPSDDNILRYDVTVTLTKSYFTDGKRTKIFGVYPKNEESLELKTKDLEYLDDLQYDEKVTFSLETFDKAGNRVNAYQTVVGYTRPEQSEILDPYNQAKQTIITENGSIKHMLVINLKQVDASAYRLRCEKVGIEGFIYSEILTSGNWNVQVAPHGRYRFWVQTFNKTAYEGNGEVGQIVESQPVEIQIYNLPPSLPNVSVPSYVKDTSITLTHKGGSDNDGDTLTYYNKITENGKVIVDPIKDGETKDTSFTLANLKDGKRYTWEVGVWDEYDLDQEGNQNIIYTNPVSFTMDKSFPSISVSPPDEEKYMNIDKVTITSSDNISGLRELRYMWRIPNKEDDPTAVIEEGEIKSGDSLLVKDGEYELIITAIDEVGNTNNQKYLYKNDSTAPVIEEIQINGIQLGDNYLSETSAVQFDVQFKEDQSLLEGFYYCLIPKGVTVSEINEADLEWVYIDPEKLVLVNDLQYKYQFNQTLYNTKSLEAGVEYYLYVQVLNEVGLQAIETTEESIILDLTGPEFTNFEVTGLSDGVGGKYLTDLAELVVNCEAEDLESGKQSIEYGAIIAEEINPKTWYQSMDELKENWNYDDGTELKLVVKATNGLGNETFRYSDQFIVDLESPELVYIRAGCDPTLVDDSPYYQQNNRDLNIVWKMSDATGIAEYAYGIGRTINDREVSKLFADADEDGWIVLSDTSLEQQMVIHSGEESFDDGTYYITIRGRDFAGNERIVTANPIIIDSSLATRPEITINPYLTSLTSLPIQLSYSGELNVVEYHCTLYHESDGELVEVYSEIITPDSKDYSGIVSYTFSQGERYYLKAEAELEDGSFIDIWSPRILIDTTDPKVVEFNVPKYSIADEIIIDWQAEDLDYGIEGEQGLNYQVKLGYSRGGDELLKWTDTLFNRYLFKDLEVLDGENIYVTLKVTNAAGLSIEVYSEAITIDNSVPEVPVITHQYGLFTANKDILEYDWSLTNISDSKLDHYEVTILHTTIIPENAEWINVGIATNYSYEALLINGSTYYLAVRAYGKNGLYSEGISDIVIIDYTKPDLISVDDKMNYSADTKTLAAEFDV
ncbi:MAG: fibronectin type III domain-containing protein, partial [Halanaerobiales bacterium]|nr:fibronectin type III domain-containing protein [Halanaerobiales bacterium]